MHSEKTVLNRCFPSIVDFFGIVDLCGTYCTVQYFYCTVLYDYEYNPSFSTTGTNILLHVLFNQFSQSEAKYKTKIFRSTCTNSLYY